jgi:ribosomal protein S27AE
MLAGRIADFYSVGDDKLMFVKRLCSAMSCSTMA